MRALIVGGSGYLGQFVIRAMLDAGYERVDYTYASNPLPDVSESCVGHVADVATGRGVREAIDAALRSGGRHGDDVRTHGAARPARGSTARGSTRCCTWSGCVLCLKPPH